jgi:hypothetical protein
MTLPLTINLTLTLTPDSNTTSLTLTLTLTLIVPLSHIYYFEHTWLVGRYCQQLHFGLLGSTRAGSRDVEALP